MANHKMKPLSQFELDIIQPNLTKWMKDLSVEEKCYALRLCMIDYFEKIKEEKINGQKNEKGDEKNS